MDNVLFVTHQKSNCGVYNYGYNVHKIIQHSTRYNFIYIECTGMHDVMNAVGVHNPTHIIYNFHPSTIGWISPTQLPTIKQFAINHEPSLNLPQGLVGDISQDPSFVEHDNSFKTGRPIIKFDALPYPERTTISTFGFTFGNNAYTWTAQTVNEQFDDAILRIHIPYATYGDVDGASARNWDAQLRALITKPGIDLIITHEYKTFPELLTWLGESTLNIFAYQVNYGRGCSGTIDYALAVKKPMAVSTSYQFKHFQSFVPEINFQHNSLKSIIDRGCVPTDKFREIWSNENLISDYERILGSRL